MGAVITEGSIPTLVTRTAELDMCKYLSQTGKRFTYTHEFHSVLPVLLHFIWDIGICHWSTLGRRMCNSSRNSEGQWLFSSLRLRAGLPAVLTLQ
jgi:hypothetical protein